jgi:hypothetical protein
MRDNDKHYYSCSLYLDSLSDITQVYEQAQRIIKKINWIANLKVDNFSLVGIDYISFLNERGQPAIYKVGGVKLRIGGRDIFWKYSGNFGGYYYEPEIE